MGLWSLLKQCKAVNTSSDSQEGKSQAEDVLKDSLCLEKDKGICEVM